LDETVVPAPPEMPCSRIPVKPPDPPTQLLQMLLWIVRGALSELCMQEPVAVPVTVTFEKLLLLWIHVRVALPNPELLRPIT